MAMHLSTKRWQDQLILLIGLWLILTPWALGYAPNTLESLNAIVVGALMVVLAAFDLYKTYLWAVLINAMAAVWVAFSPWVLHYTFARPLAANAIVVGVAVLVLAIWELRSDPELHQQWESTKPVS
ncbi:MAG: SPW repeat protein [Pseudomonadota bacterium]